MTMKTFAGITLWTGLNQGFFHVAEIDFSNVELQRPKRRTGRHDAA